MTVDEYTDALKGHDWYFQYSDDHRVYEAGNAQFKKLREAQRALDPLGTLWNQQAPREYKISAR